MAFDSHLTGQIATFHSCDMAITLSGSRVECFLMPRLASKEGFKMMKPCLCLPAMQACVGHCETLVDLGRPRRLMKNMKLCESTKRMAEGPIWHMCYEEAKPVQTILRQNYQLLNARSLQETQQIAMPKIHQKPSKVIKTTKDFSADSSSQMPRKQWATGTFFK